MPLIPFPNVPNVPGVPALPRSPASPPFVRTGLGLLQGFLWRAFQVEDRWGIYDSDGNPLGDPSNFTGLIGAALEAVGLGSQLSTNAVEVSKESRISDFPVERGYFATYNKILMPANPVVTLCMTGNEEARRSFLDAIDAAWQSTDLYSVVTPEVAYVNYSIERYNYQRTSTNGATMLTVELYLKEIREVSAQFTQAGISQIIDPKDVGSTPELDNGKVQAVAPDVSTLKAIFNKIPGLAP